VLPREFGRENGFVVRRVRDREGHEFVNAHQSPPHHERHPAAGAGDPTRRENVVLLFLGELIGDLKRGKRDVQEPALELSLGRPFVLDLGRLKRRGDGQENEHHAEKL